MEPIKISVADLKKVLELAKKFKIASLKWNGVEITTTPMTYTEQVILPPAPVKTPEEQEEEDLFYSSR